MTDETQPTPKLPTDEPTAAFEEEPDEPTVTLNITQMTSDEPSTSAAAADESSWPAPTPVTQGPVTQGTVGPPDRQKQLAIGLGSGRPGAAHRAVVADAR
jgi:hypothetical protein